MAARVLERVPHDLLAAGAGDELEALDDLVGLSVLDAGVEVLLVLADDHHVHPRVPRGHEWRMTDARPDVGVQAERLAQRHVQALVAAAGGRRDRRLEEQSCVAQRAPGLRSDACAVPRAIDRLTDLDGTRRDPGTRRVENRQRRGHDLGADAVAAGDGNGHVGGVLDGRRRAGGAVVNAIENCEFDCGHGGTSGLDDAQTSDPDSFMKIFTLHA